MNSIQPCVPFCINLITVLFYLITKYLDTLVKSFGVVIFKVSLSVSSFLPPIRALGMSGQDISIFGYSLISLSYGYPLVKWSVCWYPESFSAPGLFWKVRYLSISSVLPTFLSKIKYKLLFVLEALSCSAVGLSLQPHFRQPILLLSRQTGY